VDTGHAGASNLRGVFVASYTDEPEGGLPPLSGSDEVVLTPTSRHHPVPLAEPYPS
jgi:cytochrome c